MSQTNFEYNPNHVSKEDIKRAKTTRIYDLMSAMGHKVVKQVNNHEMLYISPFRPNEKTASFKINTQYNSWIDFGESGTENRTYASGNILDLVMRIKDCNFGEAVKTLLNHESSRPPQQKPIQPSDTSIENQVQYKYLSELKNPILIDYLVNVRKINVEIAKKYVQEIYYSINGSKYFSVAFVNNSGGYELRNQLKKSKICLGTKDITTLFYSLNKKSKSVLVFEGFMDFLSYLTYYQLTEIDCDVIVLNSSAQIYKCRDEIMRNQYSMVKLYLDNGDVGEKARDTLMAELKDDSNSIGVSDFSSLYTGFDDFNDFIVSN